MKKNDLYPSSLFEQKKAFRIAALSSRDLISEEQRKQKSILITGRLCGMSAVKDACLWFVYVSFRSEVETRSLIELLLAEGKHVSVPSIDRSTKTMSASLVTSMESDLVPGSLGILEPAAGRLKPVESRQPDVKWNDAGLDAKSEKEQQKRRRPNARRKLLATAVQSLELHAARRSG